MMFYTTLNLHTFDVLLPLSLVALLALLIASVFALLHFETNILRPLISQCCFSPIKQSSIPQIILFTQLHLLQQSFLSTTYILSSPVPFPSQNSSFHFVLPTLASSTSPVAFFLLNHQWHYLCLIERQEYTCSTGFANFCTYLFTLLLFHHFHIQSSCCKPFRSKGC